MNFWEVVAKTKEGKEINSFIIKSPYKRQRTKEILISVHPEYQKLSFKKIKRPSWCLPWEGEVC